MVSKDKFFKKFKLSWVMKVKVGEEVISELQVAKPNGADDKLWEMLNNTLDKKKIQEMYDIIEGADILGEDEKITWRLDLIDVEQDGGGKMKLDWHVCGFTSHFNDDDELECPKCEKKIYARPHRQKDIPVICIECVLPRQRGN